MYCSVTHFLFLFRWKNTKKKLFSHWEFFTHIFCARHKENAFRRDLSFFYLLLDFLTFSLNLAVNFLAAFPKDLEFFKIFFIFEKFRVQKSYFIFRKHKKITARNKSLNSLGHEKWRKNRFSFA